MKNTFMQFTMTKIKLLFVLLCMSTVFTNAQEIKVKSFQKLDNDLFARTNPRFDLNEEPCTVIRFITTGKGLQFEGNVIGEPLYFVGETLIYMPLFRFTIFYYLFFFAPIVKFYSEIIV